MDRDTTRDQNIKENETFDGDCLDLPDIPLPETDNVLYSILNSLNQNIADFHTFVKFNPYRGVEIKPLLGSGNKL